LKTIYFGKYLQLVCDDDDDEEEEEEEEERHPLTREPPTGVDPCNPTVTIIVEPLEGGPSIAENYSRKIKTEGASGLDHELNGAFINDIRRVTSSGEEKWIQRGLVTVTTDPYSDNNEAKVELPYGVTNRVMYRVYATYKCDVCNQAVTTMKEFSMN